MNIDLIFQVLMLLLICGIAYLDRKFRDETKALINQQNEIIQNIREKQADLDYIILQSGLIKSPLSFKPSQAYPIVHHFKMLCDKLGYDFVERPKYVSLEKKDAKETPCESKK